MTHDIQPADPQLKRRFLLGMTGLAILIALGIHALDAYLLELHVLAQDAQPTAAAKAQDLIRMVLALLIAGTAALCLYLARSSWQTLKSERFPPPGTRVLSDTPIRRGAQARRYGQAGLLVAVLVMLVTVVVATQASRLLGKSFDTQLKPTPVFFDETPPPSIPGSQ